MTRMSPERRTKGGGKDTIALERGEEARSSFGRVIPWPVPLALPQPRTRGPRDDGEVRC